MGRPRTEDPNRMSTQIRMGRDLHGRIQAEADAREVSVNWLVCRLLSEGLDSLRPVAEMRLTRDPVGGQSGSEGPQT